MSSSAKSSRTSSVARATTGISAATKVEEEEVVISHQVEMVLSTETKTTETFVGQTIISAAAAAETDVATIAGLVSEANDDNQVDDGDNKLEKEEGIVVGGGGRGVVLAAEEQDKEGGVDHSYAVGTNEAEADNDDNDGVLLDQNNSVVGDDDEAAPVPTFNMSMQTMTEPEDAPLVGSSDVSLALALSFLQSAEQRIASEHEADSRQLSNNTAWHAATKRLTQWLSEHFHKRAGTLEDLMVQTSSEVAEGVEGGVASPFATVLRGSFSDEFQSLATYMWASVSASLEELASLREERQQLIQGGVELRQQLSKKEVEYKVGVAAGEERAKELQDLCAAKDEMMAALNAEIIHQKDTIQKMSQTLESSNDRLKEKDALIAEFTSQAVSTTKSSETAAAAAACCVVSEEGDITTSTDIMNNAAATPAAIEASVSHLSEKLERTELALKSALAELSQKGSEIASLSWSLNMVAETHKSELNEVLEASKKAAARLAAAADDEEARGSSFLGGKKVDTSSLGPVLPTFTEASHFYLQGREEINTLRAQVGKLKVRADKVDGLESQVQVAEGRVQQLVACMVGLEEEIQQQRGSEKRLRAEQVALRAEKAALVSQVVQLCLNAGYNHNNNTNSQMERTATNLSHDEGGEAGGLQSFAATITTSSPPSAEDIHRVVNESLSVIHAATVKAAAAAASSSSLVDSSSHQELVEAHRKLKSDVNKLGKDRDYLEKLVVSRRQRLQALTSQTVSASLLQNADTTSANTNSNNNSHIKQRSIQSASVHQAAAALAQLASELATETRGTLTTVMVPSRATAEGAAGGTDDNNDSCNVVVSSLNNTTTAVVDTTTTTTSAVSASTASTQSPSIATFEMISNAMIDNVTLKDTVRNLEVEIGVLSATIRNMKEQQSMPIATVIDGVIQQQQDSSSSVTNNAVENVVTVVNSLMSRCGLLGAQGKDLQNTVATVSKALLHTKKDSTQVESSLAVLQGTLPAVANSVASALAQCGNMQQRLVASKEKVVTLKASLVELQATQMAEQEEIRRQVELIGSKRPREEDEGAESSSNVIMGATLLVSEAKSVATNITTLAGTLHGLKQLTACRKLIEIVASLEKELDEQQVAHASEIAKLGSEFIKGASGGGGAMAASMMAATPDGPRDQQRSAAMVKTFLTTALTV